MLDNSELQLKVIRKVHNQPIVNHSGVEKTLEMIRQSYYWPKMKETTQQYICNCHACKRAKALRDIYHGLLQPLLVPQKPWVNVKMDFVTGLPTCKAYGQEYDAILMVVD